jgi:hypothetical protein
MGLVLVVHDTETGDHYAESMWVRPRFRRRSAAAALLGAAERYVVDRGGSVLRLWVLDGNPDAVAAYRRYGFRPTGRRQEVPGFAGVHEEEFIIDIPSAPTEPASRRSAERQRWLRWPATDGPAGGGSAAGFLEVSPPRRPRTGRTPAL